MKYQKLLHLLIAITITFLAGSCGKPASTITISCDDFYLEPHQKGSITVNSGDEILLSLCSNPSTGFLWSEYGRISNPDLISQLSHDYQTGDELKDPAPGTPGAQTWVIKALNPGTAKLELDYSRNWEGGEKSVWTYVLSITVK